jgi:hypothetical protein
MAASSTSSTIIHLLHGQPFAIASNTLSCSYMQYQPISFLSTSYTAFLQILSHSSPSSHQHHVDRIPSWCPSEMLSRRRPQSRQHKCQPQPRHPGDFRGRWGERRGSCRFLWWIWFRPMIFIGFHGTSVREHGGFVDPSWRWNNVSGTQGMWPHAFARKSDNEFSSLPNRSRYNGSLPNCSTNIPKRCKQEGFEGW